LILGLKVVQPNSVKSDEFIRQIKNLEPDFLVVTAFGQILPPDLLKISKYGAINIHASLLPEYRGPAPIQWAIINREKETGVTTMLMNSGLDTGDIILKEITAISNTDTAETLHDRLSELGAQLILKTLDQMANNSFRPAPQDHTRATCAPLLNKKDGHINWEKSAWQLDAFIRGMTPWPGAFTFYENKRIKIFSSKPIEVQTDALPGTAIRGFDDELRIATGDGALLILEIQGSSGKRMGIKDFLRGHPISPGTRFS
jgi:methionyl-tRNA formyltransferase